MRRTLTAGLVLALTFSALGGSVLAQAEADPDPTGSPVAGEPDSDAIAEPEVELDSEAMATPPVEVTLPFVDPRWGRITPEKGPAAREDHTWTMDGEGRYAYLFGGRDGDREYGDLWRYDLVRDKWKRLRPKGKAPTPRFGHNAVWVDAHGVVVFAGQRGTDFFNDLWAFDPDRGKWRKLPTRGAAPRKRYGSCLVVGPDDRLWVSHGFTNAGRFDDTRAYNLKSERWAVLTPDGRVPGERCLHECFTSATGELVLYGGQDDGAFALGDLWTMGRDREWRHHDDPRPKPRRLYGVTEAGDYAYVFGGAGEDDQPLADLWRVDRRTLEFERVRVGGGHPAARYAGTLITDTQRGRLLLFGGQGANAKADVWELVDRAPAANEPMAEPDEPMAEPGEPAGESAGEPSPAPEIAVEDT